MGRKLLVVDDKREIRLLIRSTLEYEGWDVIEADSGEKGVEAARLNKPELIIMDLIMPGALNGIEATRRIKADPDTAGSKVIMLSGEDIEIRGSALEAGVTEFIQKPFSPLDLINMIEAMFGKGV
jgi:CheY-like chemotaxis protein